MSRAALQKSTWPKIIGEHNRRPYENRILQTDFVPKGYVTFYCASIPNDHFVFDKDLLTYITVFPDASFGQYVGKTPNPGARANLLAVANRFFMNKDTFELGGHLTPKVGSNNVHNAVNLLGCQRRTHGKRNTMLCHSLRIWKGLRSKVLV